MKKNEQILKFQIFSFIFTAIFGTLLHFTYEWSNNNSLIGTFSAVNESTWEHLKLIFFPMLFTTIIGYFYIGRNTFNFLCAKTVGIIVSMLFIVVFFYTSTGILGTNIDILNIASFFIAVFLGEFITYKFLLSDFLCNKTIAVFTLFFLFICFILFTYFTPEIGLFKDPVSGEFGITQ